MKCAVRIVLLLLSLLGVRGTEFLSLPPRPTTAPGGSQLTNLLGSLTLTDREARIYAEIARGNIPDSFRTLVPLSLTQTVGGAQHRITVQVMPEYLALGSDADYLLMPMTPVLAQRVARLLDACLPTRKLVNLIWTNAAAKLAPQPIPPSSAMTTVPVFAQHNAIVRTQRLTFAAPAGSLVAGHKKDVVVSPLIYTHLKSGVPQPVVIYGWHYQNGSPIQPLYNGHGDAYADYSHGIRLIRQLTELDGAPTPLSNVLQHATLSALLSDEGMIEKPFYPTAPWPPVIVAWPSNLLAATGATAKFEVLAAGDAPMTYRWLRGGTHLPGATQLVLQLTNTQPSDVGSYRLVLSNAAGVVTSAVATLRLYAPTSRLEGAHVTPQGTMRFELHGRSGQPYQVEMTSNLASWFPLPALTPSNGSTWFAEPALPGTVRRFYRARALVE